MRSSFLWWAGLSALALLPACRQPAYLLQTAYNFDATTPPPGWGTSTGPRSTDHSRSAPYCTWVGRGRTYSDGYAAPLGTGPDQPLPRKVRVTGWVWVSTPRARGVELAVVVQCHGRRADDWQSRSITRVITRLGQWEEIEFTYRLPADLHPTDQLVVYMWHGAPTADPVYLDDLAISTWR